MSKERLQEKGLSEKLKRMKKNLYPKLPIGVKEETALVFGQYNLEVHRLQKEVERLQAEIEQNKTWHKRDYEALCQEQNKVERLESKVKEALTYLRENSGTVEYPRQLTMGELTMLYDILALETEGKE
jgi:hypothetical protein